MIELRNVTKYYPVGNGLRYILRDISITIPTRINLAVLGPNGAGKSTFLRLLGGSEPPNRGTIITDEQISWPFGIATGFKGTLTGRQNVLFVCQINGLNDKESKDVITRVQEFAELGEYFDMPTSTYSSGMGGRLKFGLSIAFDFDVYLIDELTSAGDTIFKEKATAAFEEIRKRASLILVSHSLKSVKASCQAAVFLRDGMCDYYPNIDDGADAYAAYIEEHRHKGLSIEGSSDSELKKANRRAERLDNRSARKLEKGRTPGDLDEKTEDKTEDKTEEKALKKSLKKADKKAKKKAAKEASRQDLNVEESATENPIDTNQSSDR